MNIFKGDNNIMVDICNCCGNKISFLEVDFDYIEIDNESYKICGKCKDKINVYNSGNISINEIISDNTNEKVADYLKYIKSGERMEHNKKERIESSADMQKKDILYNDIHQIAGDLRFIKNLIIIGLVGGLILGIIGVLGLM